MTILDLFSGIGGFSLALKRVYKKKILHLNSDIDKYSNDVYKYHFKESINYGSIKNIQPKKLPKIDIITFGSPCQDFSMAGKRKGLDGQRSSLIIEAIRLIKQCKPDFFIWENVKGTFSSNSGEDFAAILQAFNDIGGYRLEWQLLNTKWFLPQNRERIYLVGLLGKGSGQQVFPITENGILFNKKIRNKTRQTTSKQNRHTRTIRGGIHKMGNDDSYIKVKGGLQKNAASMINLSPSLTSAMGMGGGHTPIIQIKTNTKKGYEIAKKGDTINFQNPKSKTRRGRIGKGIAQTLDTSSSQYIVSDKIRRLTPLECERLQGFPDNWTKYGTKGLISDTQRYKMCGNAVTVDVVEAIFKKILL